MSNTIVRIRKRPSESNAPCCIYGRRVVRSTLSMRKTEVRWAFGGNGLRDAHGQAMKGGHFFPEENPDDTAVLVKQFLSA